MKSQNANFLIAFSFFIIVMVGFGIFHFQREQRLMEEQINNVLDRSVHSAALIIGNEYHEKVLKSPPSKEEDMEIIRTLSVLAAEQGVEYVYSLILDPQGQLRFTSSSAKPIELESGKDLTRFYDLYDQNPKMVQALESDKPVYDFDDVPDKWGQFRSLYIPYTTQSGERYIIGADIDIQSIRHLSYLAFYKAMVQPLVLFIAILPLLFVYRRTVKRTAEYLHRQIAESTAALRRANEALATRVEEKNNELITQGYVDALTGLPNRFQIIEDLSQKPYYALLILNLHGFREINDFFGIRVGDDLIRQTGVWLKKHQQHVYRLGGDEFVVLIHEPIQREAIESRCKKMLSRFSSHPFSIGEETISLNMTVGVDTSENLSLAHADIALHDAKECGGHIAFYKSEDGIEKQYKQNIALAAAIHKALRDGRIVCYFQPIFSLETNRIHKYESLVRMIEEDGNVLPPSEFLKIAQKTRLYSKISEQVIQYACTAFASRNEEFSVNLSIGDILNPATVEFIEKTITETATADRIVFEILESEGIENFDTVSAFIRRMKQLGAKIAIDDFGSGYSSMENILRLDIDYIKIDGSIIRSIHTNPRYAIAVEAVATFASKLGIKTIAEFVSSEEIYEQVKSIGIDYSQGYYTGKPEPLPL